MSINQIESRQLSQLLPSSPRALPQKALPTSSFSEAMNSATGKLPSGNERDPVQVATAMAELLKLEMMKSALSLGGEAVSPSSGLLTLPVKLGMYEHIPESQNTDISSGNNTSQQSSIPDYSQKPDAPIQEIVNRASQKYGVDGALIKAVIKAESNFNPSAVSHAGAQGLMQLMPATARGLGVNDSFNPEQNVMAGTRFLKDMINRYHGNLDAALAAYNWGPGNVDRKGISSLPQETKDYLVKVKNLYNQYAG